MQYFTLGDDYIVDRCLHSPLYFYRVKTVDSGPQRTRAAWALARAQGSLGPWQMLTVWAALTKAGTHRCRMSRPWQV